MTDDDDDGIIARKLLPDGREACVVRTIFNGRLTVGPPGEMWYDDCWCYDSVALALVALQAWDGTGEPEGWKRHHLSGRRRPEGDPLAEYIRA